HEARQSKRPRPSDPRLRERSSKWRFAAAVCSPRQSADLLVCPDSFPFASKMEANRLTEKQEMNGSKYAAGGNQTSFRAAMTGRRAARMAGRKLPNMPTITEKINPWVASHGVMRNSNTVSLKLSKLKVPVE